MSLTEDLATTWRSSHARLLMTAPDTEAQHIFARMAVPGEQHTFHQQCQAERVTGTCDWFLQTKEYQAWREHDVFRGDANVLWCQGKPGIGKTMLASKMIDTLRTSHFVAYFYMSSGGAPYSATDVTASLLRQLCVQFRIVPQRLQQLYECTDPAGTIRLDLDDVLEAVRQVAQDIDQPIMIIIDGLDECNMSEQRSFIKLFAGLKETFWKSLITSRFDEDILAKACGGCLRFSIKDENVENDIRHFVDSALRGTEPINNMLRDRVFRSEVIETLTSRAHGMFYWVSLQLRRILDQINVSGIKRTLHDIPSEIGGIVKGALHMINMQGLARAQLATRTLALLTAAKAPMTAEAMSHAMGMYDVLDSDRNASKLSEDEMPNPVSIIECCMGLVAIDPITRVVTLPHFDIAQYMQIHWDFLFSWKENLMLANITLAYLSLNAFSTGPCRQAESFNRRLEAYPFLEYASRHWGHHAREAMLLQHADAEDGQQALFRNVNGLLKGRMKLESSLQVCNLNSMPSRVRETLLQSNDEDFALHANKFRSVSNLQVAAHHGFSAIAREIIEGHPDTISNQDDFGRSAMHEAAQAGWDDLVDMLLQARAQPSPKDQNEKAPVYYAALNGNTKIITLLLKEEIGEKLFPERSGSCTSPSRSSQIVSTRRDQGDPSALQEAFCDAVEAGKLGVIQELLTYDVNLANSKKQGQSAIMLAIHRGHDKILQKLLSAGACVSCPDLSPSDQIPLHQAIRDCDNDMVAILLNYGANVETRDEYSRTALFETLNCDDTNGAILLFGRGISIDSPDNLGNTVLHEAIRMGAMRHTSLFIGRNMELTGFNNEGLTPLHLAARHDRCRILNDLLKKGADTNIVDRKAGWTPLMYAASTGSTELCQILLSFGADVAKTSSDHKTPLMIAAAAGHYQLATLLLSAGAEVDAMDAESKTPLLLAAAGGHAQLVRLLLEHGADVNTVD